MWTIGDDGVLGAIQADDWPQGTRERARGRLPVRGGQAREALGQISRGSTIMSPGRRSFGLPLASRSATYLRPSP